MHRVAEPTCGDLLQRRLEVVELLAHRGPVVDDEEDVCPLRAFQLAARAARTQRRGRVDPGIRKSCFALVQERGHFSHRAAHALGILPSGNAADVPQPGERRQAATAEVDAVELRLSRGVSKSERGDQRPHQCGFARERSADHHQVSRRTCEVDLQDAA